MTSGQKSQRKHAIALALLFCAEFLLRLFAAGCFSDGNWAATNFPDEKNYYLSAAQAILDQGLTFFETPRSLWNGPLNPLWIALWQGSVAAVKIANIFLISLCSLAVWDMARKLFGYHAAYLALFLFAVHPPLFEFGPTLLTEPLFVSLIIASLWLQICMPLGQRSSPVVAGILMGLAVLTRPTVQLFPLALSAAVFARRFVHSGNLLDPMDRAGTRLLVFAAAALLTVLPYNVKNYVYFEKFGVANGFGAVLYLGNDLRTGGDEPLYSQMNFDTYAVSAPYTHLDIEGDRRLAEAAIRKISAHPVEILQLTALKALKFLFGYPQHYFYPVFDVLTYQNFATEPEVWRRAFEVTLVCFVVSFGFAALLCMSITANLRLLLATYLVYMVGLHSIAFAIPRLALPVFPVLAVLAAGGSMAAFRSRRLLPLLLGSLVFICSVSYILYGARDANRALVDESVLKGFSEQFEISTSAPHSLTDIRVDGEGFTSAGANPSLILTSNAVVAHRNEVVLIELRAQRAKASSRKPLSLRLFWAVSLEQGFEESRSVSINLLPDGEFHWYRFSPSSNLSWSGPLSAFRLDFGPRARGAHYQIRRIIVAH